MNTFKQWLKNMLSTDGSVSSKRVVGFGAFVLFIIMVITHLVGHQIIQTELIWSDVALITACFGLNAWIDVKALTSKSEVASNIASQNPSPDNAQTAQDVLQNPKP